MQILYFFDPLCGWCYGFSPAIVELYENWKDRAEFEVVGGGMVTGNRVGPLSEIAEYLKKAYPDVEARSGMRFGPAYLEKLETGDMMMDSTPPSRALAVYKEIGAKHPLYFAQMLQHSIYYDGIGPTDNAEWCKRAEKLGLKSEFTAADFSDRLESESSLDAAQQGYYESQQHGIQGFPSVVVESANQLYLVARGYRPASELFPILEELAAKEA